VQEEPLRVKFRKTLYEEVTSLQRVLNAWLRFYGYERPHLKDGTTEGEHLTKGYAASLNNC